MKLPSGANNLIKLLLDRGFEAYAVGGAVRDGLLGKPFSDVDITTSATPSEMLEVFKNFKVIKTGLKHGTLTVVYENQNYEITTYRIDGEYSDNRRPDEVTFTKSLKEDLKRRDFTVNAIAYNEVDGLIDEVGGINDLNRKIIRAVGDADKRFKEDALRILRALRFSSTLNYRIEKDTSIAIKKNAKLLKNVAVERIFVELKKLLSGSGVERVLFEYKEVFFVILPELKATDGLDQKSKYHYKDVYGHIVKSVALSKNNTIVRLALLLHDIGKPNCFTVDEKGVGHFFGHQEISADITKDILKRLKVDNYTLKTVYNLVLLHDCRCELSSYEIKKLLNEYGFEFVKLLCEVKIGDAKAHDKKFIDYRVKLTKDLLYKAKKIVYDNECYTLKQLAVNGNDLINKGIVGIEVKEVLNSLLDKVMKGELKNEKQILLENIRV